MVRTAINLYSVRQLDEPLVNILDRVADAGYDGVQFSGGFRDATHDEAAAKADERGLDVTPAHVDIDALEGDLDATIAAYRDTVGCSGAVVPYLDDSHFASRDAVDETAERLTALADQLADLDWTLHYHNHAHEFVDLDGENAFERFVREASGVGIELDVGWALVGGADPVSLIERYGDRIDVLHMKDMDVATEAFREIGDGDVDMGACAEAGREANLDWFVYEHDDPEDPVSSIETGSAFLDGL